MSQSIKLLDQFRRAVRLRHYSRRTEEAYIRWVRRFVRFHGLRHPTELGATEISKFLSNLATERGVSASTQNQALAAILFLYGEVLGQSVGWVPDVVRAKDALRLPVVLTRAEVRAVLGRMTGVPRLVAALLYGSGLRLLEALQLRVKDVDFGGREIRVRGGKGNRDRVTMLPDKLVVVLRGHLEGVQRQHEGDVADGAGWVELPGALDRKYVSAGREWPWQWVFPAAAVCGRYDRSSAAASFARDRRAAGFSGRAQGQRGRQEGLVSHAAPLVRDPPAAGRV